MKDPVLSRKNRNIDEKCTPYLQGNKGLKNAPQCRGLKHKRKRHMEH
jgi:hypothetical protein